MVGRPDPSGVTAAPWLNAALTIELVGRLLAPITRALMPESGTWILSTNRFAVRTAQVCPGCAHLISVLERECFTQSIQPAFKTAGATHSLLAVPKTVKWRYFDPTRRITPSSAVKVH